MSGSTKKQTEEAQQHPNIGLDSICSELQAGQVTDRWIISCGISIKGRGVFIK